MIQVPQELSHNGFPTDPNERQQNSFNFNLNLKFKNFFAVVDSNEFIRPSKFSHSTSVYFIWALLLKCKLGSVVLNHELKWTSSAAIIVFL